jgi:AraC family transcriptional regulator
MSFYGDPFDSHSGWDEENQIGLLWKRFFKYLGENPSVAALKRTGACYEVHIYGAETAEKGLFEVFVGVECGFDQIKSMPVELSVRNLPAALYAVFTLKGREITGDWEKMIRDWLPASGYRSAGSYGFQYYTEQFKGLDRLDESTLDVYIPIRKLLD